MTVYFLDVIAHRFWRNGTEIILSGTEYRMVSYLWQNRGKVMLVEQIIEEIWAVSPYTDYDLHMLHENISRIRKKLPALITTRRGLGYGILSR